MEIEYDCRLLGTVLGRTSISWGRGSDGLQLRCEEFKTEPNFFCASQSSLACVTNIGPRAYIRSCGTADPLTETRRAMNLEHGICVWCPSGGQNMEGLILC